jgi:hypothetical protein
MNFGTKALYNKLLNKVQFQKNWDNESHTLLNTLGTGDADLRHLRFCVINVKDGRRKIAF